jgi:membrane-bound ClpP family serine protease
MKAWIRIAPVVSFVFCLLGGIILVLNGLDRSDFAWCGLGLFFIGIAFIVGPMLGLAAEVYSKMSDKK